MPDTTVIPGTETMPPAATPPAGSPGSTPQVAAGEVEQAKANVQIAIQVLEHTLPVLGTSSEDGQAVHKAIGLLSKRFTGKKSEDLAPAELMQMMSTMPDQYKQAMAAQMTGGEAPGAATPPGAPGM